MLVNEHSRSNHLRSVPLNLAFPVGDLPAKGNWAFLHFPVSTHSKSERLSLLNKGILQTKLFVHK